MRYTKKGQQKLVDYLYAYGAYVSGLRTNAPDPLVFEPDDFEGVVVLTTKEAKKLQKEFVDVICDVAIASGCHEVRLPKPASFAMLEEKIAQREEGNDSH